VKSGEIRALISCGENPIKAGISLEHLMHLPAFVAMDILSNEANDHATVRLPASGFAEKRGSMINGKGRLQRLNRATRPPGNARDDWEILRDLLQGLGGGNGIYTIEDVFRQMSAEIHQFHGLTLSKIGDLGVHVIKEDDESPRPPRDPKERDIERAEKKRPPGR
jgi:NADH-quinone oxidoreductase subunit G